MLTSKHPGKIANFEEEGSIPWPLFVKFLGQFAHDIRNGLNAVELQLTLAGELSNDPEVSEEIKRARHSVGDLARKIQAARNSTTEIQINAIEYKVADFLEDLRHGLARRSPEEAKNVEVASLNGEAGHFEVDPEALPLALSKIIENAHYFADKGAPIQIEGLAEEDDVVIRLTEKREAAPDSDPATWGEQPLASGRRGGYGLGLFQARRIVAAHGGDISIEYQPKEKNLVTSVRIPRRMPSLAP